MEMNEWTTGTGCITCTAAEVSRRRNTVYKDHFCIDGRLNMGRKTCTGNETRSKMRSPSDIER